MFKRSIEAQEQYVRTEMAKINKSDNYVSSDKNTTYTRDQIEGKLRQEYYGNVNYKNRNDYVLDNDWERMRNKK